MQHEDRAHPGSRVLSPSDISLVDVAVAAAGDRTAELRTPLGIAMTYGVTPEELADVLREAARRVGRCDDVFIVLLSKSPQPRLAGRLFEGVKPSAKTAIGAESCQRVDTATACRRVGAARAAQVAPITSHIIAWFASE